MDPVAHYRRQCAWRAWPQIVAQLPPLVGRRVLDLGCGVGDPAACLAAAGAQVLGIDGNAELLAAARALGVPRAEFRLGDLRELPALGGGFDVAWASFVAAYFPDFGPVLARWGRELVPGGVVALTEIDDLFGHEPLRPRTQERLDAFAAEALRAGRYDFHMGRRLPAIARAGGFEVLADLAVPDAEFATSGALADAVLQGWAERLQRMALLHAFCGADWPAVRDDFLACLRRPDHVARSTVRCCIARKGTGTGP